MKKKRIAPLTFRFLGKKYSLRVSESTQKLIDDFHLKTGISYTDVIVNSFLWIIKDSEPADEQTKVLKDEFIREIELKKKREFNTEVRHCLFLIKNTIYTLTDMQTSFYAVSGELDMPMANKVLEMAESEFKKFPKSVQKLMQNKFNNLMDCKGNEEKLRNVVRLTKLLENKPDDEHKRNKRRLAWRKQNEKK